MQHKFEIGQRVITQFFQGEILEQPNPSNNNMYVIVVSNTPPHPDGQLITTAHEMTLVEYKEEYGSGGILKPGDESSEESMLCMLDQVKEFGRNNKMVVFVLDKYPFYKIEYLNGTSDERFYVEFMEGDSFGLGHFVLKCNSFAVTRNDLLSGFMNKLAEVIGAFHNLTYLYEVKCESNYTN